MPQVTGNKCHKQNGPLPVFKSRINVAVRPDQRESLELMAKVLDVSVSDMARIALDTYITTFEEVRKELQQ
jgi:hypothetical protein